MANPWTDAFSELRTAIVGAWPEVATNGVFESSELQRLSGARTTLPLAIIHKIDVAEESEITPLGFQTWALRVAVHYLGTSALREDGMRERLQTLAERLLTTEMTEGKAQVIAVEALEWADDQGGNQVLITKNLAATAGTLMVRLLVGQDVHH